MVKVHIDVQQFEVDDHGRGTLVAQWRITAHDRPLKSGDARLDRAGASPHGKPELVAATLSELEAESTKR